METVFEEIYKNNYSKLYTLAFRMTGSREDSEDILQTSFLNAYRSFSNFRNKSSVYTWLYRIVVNTAKKYSKERARLPVDEYAENNGLTKKEVYDHINSFARVEDNVLVSMTRETCLQMFMNCMPALFRTVYTLRVMLELSVKETAEILDITESAVKVNLHRARKAAAKHFENRCSLIHPNGMCDCRSFTGYLVESGKTEKLCSIETVRNKEKEAVKRYNSEMDELYKIDSLYKNRIKPPDYENFIKKIRVLLNDKDYTLLQK
jgi:RNA polymerase sigma factor (sigma-70 family)